MYNNFPIFNKQFDLSKEELLEYVLVFSKHSILFTKKEDVVHTYHRYNDGILMRFTWNPLNPVQFLSSAKEEDSKCIKELVDEGYLSLENADIIFFSDANSSCEEDAYELFQKIIKQKEKRLNDSDYHRLEFPKKINISLSDDFFNEITKRNKNIIDFKEYLKKRHSP